MLEKSAPAARPACRETFAVWLHRESTNHTRRWRYGVDCSIVAGDKGRRMTDKDLRWVAVVSVLLDLPAGPRSRPIPPGKPE